jgi:3-hydroxyisobutyrate dehydrogenase
MTGDIGFVGLGTMGRAIAERLAGGGNSVLGFDVDPEAAERSLGVTAAPSLAALSSCAVVFLSLPGPVEQFEVIGRPGEGGLLGEQNAGLSVIIDLSTSSPVAAQEIAARCASADVGYVDAPVSGGRVKAAAGNLSSMVSGPAGTIAEARPYLDQIASEVFEIGPEVGSASLVKLLNNLVFLGSGLIGQEALAMAESAGLDLDVVLDVFQKSSAATYVKFLPSVVGSSFEEASFALSLAAKDLTLLFESAAGAGEALKVSRAAAAVYDAALDSGHGALDFRATYLVVRDRVAQRRRESEGDR